MGTNKYIGVVALFIGVTLCCTENVLQAIVGVAIMFIGVYNLKAKDDGK